MLAKILDPLFPIPRVGHLFQVSILMGDHLVMVHIQVVSLAQDHNPRVQTFNHKELVPQKQDQGSTRPRQTCIFNLGPWALKDIDLQIQ